MNQPANYRPELHIQLNTIDVVSIVKVLLDIHLIDALAYVRRVAYIRENLPHPIPDQQFMIGVLMYAGNDLKGLEKAMEMWQGNNNHIYEFFRLVAKALIGEN